MSGRDASGGRWGGRALALVGAVALAVGLMACAGGPEEPPAVRFDPQWWQGTWVVDTAAMTRDTASLGPDARQAAMRLLDGLAGAVRYELAGQLLRVVVAGEVTELRIVTARAKARSAELVLSDGRQVTVRRADAQDTRRAIWVDRRGELPLSRPAR